MSIITITKDNFKTEVINSDKPVLIDFWAEWCGPCKMAGIVLEEVAKEVANVKICRVNVDDEPELSVEFKVMSIPTFVVMKGGKIIQNTVGVKSKADMIKMLDV